MPLASTPRSRGCRAGAAPRRSILALLPYCAAQTSHAPDAPSAQARHYADARAQVLTASFDDSQSRPCRADAGDISGTARRQYLQVACCHAEYCCAMSGCCCNDADDGVDVASMRVRFDTDYELAACAPSSPRRRSCRVSACRRAEFLVISLVMARHRCRWSHFDEKGFSGDRHGH